MLTLYFGKVTHFSALVEAVLDILSVRDEIMHIFSEGEVANFPPSHQIAMVEII